MEQARGRADDPMEVDKEEASAPSRQQQGQLIGEIAAWQQLAEKSKWYLVSHTWWSEWRSYVGYEDSQRAGNAFEAEPSSTLLLAGVSPGAIDNKGLLVDSDNCTSEELVPRLVEGVDYSLVPSDAWTLLKKWYGGGPDICRGVIRAGGMVGGILQVEIYPLALEVEKRSLGVVKRHELLVSKKESVRNLLHSVCAMLWLPPTSTRIYLQTDSYEFTLLDDMKRSLDSYYVMSGQRILVDAARFDGSYLGPRQRPLSLVDEAADEQHLCNGKAKTESNPYYRQPSGKYVSSTRGLGMAAMWKDSTEAAVEKGVTGLINLGNTCFMSSSIQCLSNVPEFSQIFKTTGKAFEDLLNRDNAMGTGGKLAEEFAEVIKKMWSGEHAYIAPKNLKYTLGTFAPQFSGYRQQDAQELLAFLLDGLHEDLNEVVKKPYFSDQLIYSGSDVEGAEAAEVGAASWARHLARNKSKIVDLFDGLLRSLLHCPSCEQLSVTFDPFRYLSVPIPNADRCSFDVTLVRSSVHTPPTRYRVETSIHGTMKDFHRELCEASGAPFGSLLFSHESGGTVRSFLRSDAKGIGAVESFEHILAFEALAALPEYHCSTVEENNVSCHEGEPALDKCSIEARIPEGHHLVQFLFRRVVLNDEEGQSGGSGSDTEVEMVGLPLVRCLKKSATHAELMETVQQYVSLFGVAKQARKSRATAEQSPKSLSEIAYAFSLRAVTGNGKKCAVCESSSSCLGCALEDVHGGEVRTGQSIAVDLHCNVDLSMVVTDKIALNESGEDEKKTSTALKECLELFSREERLQSGQEWFCPNCKIHVNATKKLDIWKWPKVLVVHLKRFYHLQDSNKRGKVEKTVNYPFELTCAGLRYRLVAVSNHMGGIGGGHYTAHAYNAGVGKWYEFNDRLCKEVEPDAVQHSNAYILYYVQTGE